MNSKLCGIFLFFGALVCGATENNLLVNSSFEAGKARNGVSRILPGWTVRSYTASMHRIENSGAKDGKRAAVLKTDKEESGYFTPQKIEAAAGSRIHLQVQYHFKRPSKRGWAAMIVNLLDFRGKKLSYGSRKLVYLEPAENWTYAELKYQLPSSDPRGYKLDIKFQLNGPGELWIDQASLQVIAPQKNLVEFYPGSVNSHKTLYPIAGESNQLLFYVFTNSSPKNRVLELDVPESFPLTGAAAVFTGKHLASEIKKQKKSGRLYYKIKLAEKSVLPMKRSVNDLFTGTGLLFKAACDMKKDTLNWQIKGIGSGKIALEPQQPAKNLKLPENFKLYTWYTPLLSHIQSPEAISGYLDTLRKSGVAGGSLHESKADFFKNKDFCNYRCTWFATPQKCYTNMLSKSAVENYFGKLLQSMQKFDSPVLVWNYEPGPAEYYHFCADCRQAFEQDSGKSTAGLKDGKSVEKRYPAEYMLFRTRQRQEIVRRFVEICRKNRVKAILNSFVFPGSEAGMPNFNRRIGDMSPLKDTLYSYSAQVYYPPQLLWDALVKNLRHWPGMIPCFTSDERHNGDSYSYSLLTPEQVYLETVIAALQKCPAIHFFVGVFTFDGKQMLALRKAMDEIARFEDFIYRGTVADQAVKLTSRGRYLRSRAYKFKNKIMLALVNPDPVEEAFAQVALTPGMQQFKVAEPLKKLKFTQQKSENFRSGASAVFRLAPGEIRYIVLADKPDASMEKTEELPSQLPKIKESVLLDKNNCKVTAVGSKKDQPDTLIVQQGKGKAVINMQDGAVVELGKVKLFRDNVAYPAMAAWSEDFTGRYRLESCQLVNGKLEITTGKLLSAKMPEKIMLTKKLIFSHDINAVDAEVIMKNTGKKAVTVAYWNWNQLDILLKDFTVDRPGSPLWRAAGQKNLNNYLPVKWSQWVKAGNKYFIGWDTGRPQVDGLELEKWYIYTGVACPTLEQISYKQSIKPQKKVRIKLHFRVIPPVTQAQAFDPQQPFTIDNPYAVSKKFAYRASPHDHAQYAPTYKHSPVPPAERIRQLRDAKVTPPYKFSIITEHTRITLPSNTIPRGVEPQWGVDNILFIPGMEGTIGSWTHGSDYGHFFGEINCIGVSTEFKKVDDQSTYKHIISKWPENMKPEILLGKLLDDGVFVGLCHPNSKLDQNDTHRWGASGYTYDELDILFGNPEKLMPPLPRLPIALEIGNKTNDFSQIQTNFTNAEAKWDYLLSRGHRLYGTACDDAHSYSTFEGWIVVYVNELTQKDFMDSLLKGNFYASQGPEIKNIKLQDKDFTITADQPSRIEFIGRNGKVLQKEENVTVSTYRIQGNELYVRARVTRECPEMRVIGGGIGRRRSAWTNPLYIKQSK